MDQERAARALAESLDGSELVVFDPALDLVYEWNGSQTFNVHALDGETVDMWMAEQRPDVATARQMIRDRIAAS